MASNNNITSPTSTNNSEITSNGTSNNLPYEIFTCAMNYGSMAWMMACVALAILHTPALGIIQAGMARRKNSLAVLVHALSSVALVCTLWFLFVFSLTFSGNYGEFIGDFNHGLFLGLSSTTCFYGAPEISTYAYALFQMMFAIASTATLTLTRAEFITYRSFISFTGLWFFFVYMPFTHWIWGQGWLQARGALDFAGGLTVNTVGGVGALIVSLLSRTKRTEELQESHYNIPFTMLGSLLLLLSWIGLIAGGGFRGDGVAALALTNVVVSACSSTCFWIGVSWFTGDYFHLSELAGGIYCGIVGISASAGYVLPWHAFIIGIASAFFSYISLSWSRKSMRFDDQLNVVSFQGVSGIIGSLAVGFFATKQANPYLLREGVFYSEEGMLLAYQIVAILIGILWSAFWSTVLFLLLDVTIGTENAHSKVWVDPDTILIRDGLEEYVITPEHYRGAAETGFGAHPVRPTHRKPFQRHYWFAYNDPNAKKTVPVVEKDKKHTRRSLLKHMASAPFSKKFSQVALEASGHDVESGNVDGRKSETKNDVNLSKKKPSREESQTVDGTDDRKTRKKPKKSYSESQSKNTSRRHSDSKKSRDHGSEKSDYTETHASSFDGTSHSHSHSDSHSHSHSPSHSHSHSHSDSATSYSKSHADDETSYSDRTSLSHRDHDDNDESKSKNH